MNKKPEVSINKFEAHIVIIDLNLLTDEHA